MNNAIDERWMARAVSLAASTWTHPNPRVGSVLVSPRGELLAEAAHPGAGKPHAEALVLRHAGAAAAGATLYVTLEPCAHHGRTPPCADAVVEAAVARVVVAVPDPDPRVAGRGLERLRNAGIEVELGVLAEEAEALDPGYFHQRRTGRPRVTLKSAMTLDGQIAAADGTSKWITSPEARADGHRLRAKADAVMVGAGTLLSDDPQLTVRTEGYNGHQPVAIVVAGRRPLPPAARVFQRQALVLANRQLDLPVEVIVATSRNGDGVDLAAQLTELGSRGFVDVLVEGGATLAGSLLRRGLVDRGVFYLAAKLGGGVGLPAVGGTFATLADANPVRITEIRQIGSDVRIEFEREGG